MKMICVKSILEDSIKASNDAKVLTDFFFKNFPKTTIMDLRPKSKFSLSLDSDLQKKSYTKSLIILTTTTSQTKSTNISRRFSMRIIVLEGGMTPSTMQLLVIMIQR